ncbi:hypothetical protein [Geotoga petraea]|uniref:DUF1858 domain-containing protein n=1 Tax=Geotoga petraea TaxID=28234 RepID=A0A1G6JE72_9BACT|nr:hypothetical protein [Geotoga petraea]SDC17132.1 hypothetical protein SAMN04488588_0507 [Geotoga petraea]
MEYLTKDMSLKEIMEKDDKLFKQITKFGFDICCTKMDTLEDSCQKKGINLNLALNKLNNIVDDINYIEKLIEENQ